MKIRLPYQTRHTHTHTRLFLFLAFLLWMTKYPLRPIVISLILTSTHIFEDLCNLETCSWRAQLNEDHLLLQWLCHFLDSVNKWHSKLHILVLGQLFRTKDACEFSFIRTCASCESRKLVCYELWCLGIADYHLLMSEVKYKRRIYPLILTCAPHNLRWKDHVWLVASHIPWILTLYDITSKITLIPLASRIFAFTSSLPAIARRNRKVALTTFNIRDTKACGIVKEVYL